MKKQTDRTKPEGFSNGYRAPDTQRINASEGVDLREGYGVGYDPRIDPLVQNPADIPPEAAQHYSPGGIPGNRRRICLILDRL